MSVGSRELNKERRRRWQVVVLDEAEHRRGWIPLRELLGVQAFGVNAWSVENAGDPVIPAHDERQTGHEELYLVVRGHARFTVSGDEVDAPPGTIVFVRDPAAERGAVATSADTIVLSAGAKPGTAFSPSSWEWNARAMQPYNDGDYEAALIGFTEGHELFPADPTLLYNMGCMEALLGRRDDAIAHLRAAVELGAQPDLLTDDDLASLRDDSEFVAIAREADARRERA
jgi:quercetin dioxygenase-like cupin family protein